MSNITVLNNNLDLYRPDVKSYTHSLEVAKQLPLATNTKLVFHCYWRVPKDFGRKQVAVLKSIIVNHANSDVEINLWSNVDLSNNIYFKEVASFVTLKIFNLQEEIKGTVLEDCSFLKDPGQVYDHLCYLEGDVFRLLVLNKYGGFYIDMDVLVLRDMAPLNDLEFLYQWGTSGFSDFEPDITMNGAVMRLSAGSVVSQEFLRILAQTPPVKDSFIWGNKLYSRLKQNKILALPGMWFNSEWGFENTQMDPFNNIGPVNLFPGAFAWHWHNRWDAPIHIGSKFAVLEQDINNKFKSLCH